MAHDISRRDLLGVLPASFVAPLLAQQRAAPRPFMASVPQPTIDRILNRVKETRLPDRLDAPDWRYLAYHLGGPVVAEVVLAGEPAELR